MGGRFSIVLVIGFLVSFSGWSQEKDNLTKDINVDNLGNNEDEFQEIFFKAIAQRAVENPDKAIEVLKQCLKLKPESTAVFYELAKNYMDIKDYAKAEDYLLKTISDPAYQNNINIHKQIFYVYTMQKRYEEAIEKAAFIAQRHPAYFQELANLHLLKDNYRDALIALDRYDAVEGIDEFRDNFRMIIYKESGLFKSGIKFFKARFRNSGEDTRAATLLMELYRLDNSAPKAIEIGKTLKKNDVNDPEFYVEMALAYLVTKNSTEAKIYSQKVVESLTLEEKDKLKVINTFKAFAMANPEAQDDFVSVLDSALSTEKNSSSKAELGQFYKTRDKAKALENFKSALRDKPNDFEIIQNILDLELELGNYQDAVETSSKALVNFPSQGYLYFAKGKALGQLGEHAKAIQLLEEALDYIFEKELQDHVFLALAEAHRNIGNPKEAAFYEQKLNKN